MSEPVLVPAPATGGPTPPAPPDAPPAPRRRAFARRLLLPLRLLAAAGRAALRRPGRSLALLALVALLASAAGLAGAQAWFVYHRWAARRALEKYHDDEAQGHLLRCLRLKPSDPDTLFLVARVARRTGELEEAERALDRYQQQRGADDALVLERMLLLAERGQFKAVYRFCDARLEENDPSSPLILEALVRGLIRLYRLPQAEVWVDEWLRRQPDNTQALVFRGTIDELRQRQANAADSYRRAVGLDPDYTEARFRLAGVLLDLIKPAEALPHLEYLARRHPDDPETVTFLARCYDLLDEPEKAAPLLDRLLASRRYGPALAERGKLARRAGDFRRAEGWLREALAEDPGNYGNYYQLYLCLTALGERAEAREVREKMQKVHDDRQRLQRIIGEEMPRRPNDPDLCYEIALITLRSGSPREGLRWLRQAVQYDPNHVASHKALAGFYQRVGNTALAARHRELARQAESASRPGGSRQ